MSYQPLCEVVDLTNLSEHFNIFIVGEKSWEDNYYGSYLPRSIKAFTTRQKAKQYIAKQEEQFQNRFEIKRVTVK